MSVLDTDRARIQHLLRRAGFGYSADELDDYASLGLDGAVERLLHPELVDDSATDAALAPILAPFALDGTDQEVQRAQGTALYQAWYTRLVLTRRPLLERMTYFWHDHFATSRSKVRQAALLQRQNETLRAGALGSFQDLLLSVARDPAMLIYLDNRSNAKSAPNENYARELMELHTLGHGDGYTEDDIHEAARALTGWRIGPDGLAVFRRHFHDTGLKTVLGRTGNFDDADVVAILAEDRLTAEYLCDKLVRAFVHPDGDAALAARAVDTYRATHGAIREVMRTILLAPEMYSERAYRSIIKSPTEVIVGAKRALEAAPASRSEAAFARRLGQLLYEPPNPAGWTGGSDWINATTVLTRSNFAAELTSLRSRDAADIPALFRAHGVTASADEVVDWTLDLLHGGDVDPASRSVLVDHLGGSAHFTFEGAAREGLLQGMVYLALCMPLYHVA
jgi:uncharacterized protein (DUF1800 family)